MKRIIAIVLSASIMFVPFVVPAYATAVDTIDNNTSVTVMDNTGAKMEFQLVANVDGTFSLKYYLNDTLNTVYEMSADSETIFAVSADGLTTYSVVRESVSLPWKQNSEQLALNIEPRYSDLGQINYNYSSNYACSPYAILTYRITNQWVDTYTVNTYLESDYPDIIAAVVGVIIALNIPTLASGTTVTAIAVAIVEAMLINQGAEVINQIISIPFYDTYSCEITTYSIIAAVIGDGITAKATQYNDGQKCVIYYSNLYSKTEYEGWTYDNWAQQSFASTIWRDCVSLFVACPGVQSYQYEVNYPWD